ncbi:MAG: DUF1698 domain-containing protein [Acidimicrobiia bacterium]|nr:DUF1698 domain-containing protein [Acidimicrobiia bacterium]
MDLGGVVTPGHEPHTAQRLAVLHLPVSLVGKTVLDIGAWDGFFSFEAERRGAERVVAMDHDCWKAPDGFPSKAGFDLARRALGSDVEDVHLDVMELTPQRLGVFDVVFFFGVLYHLRHPLEALERVASVCGGLLILETHVRRLPTRQPAMVFYPRDELDWDTTNWWGPNEALVCAMLRDVGFTNVATVHSRRPAVSALRAGKRLRDAVRRRYPTPVTYATSDRLVVHAWR